MRSRKSQKRAICGRELDECGSSTYKLRMGAGAGLRTKREVRRSVRRHVQLDCSVLSDLWDEPVELRVTNISEDGLWIETTLPLEVGTPVTLSLLPPASDDPLYVAGEVRRVGLSRRRADPRSGGMGIAFEAMRASDRRRLGKALSVLQPIEASSAQRRTLVGVPVGVPLMVERRNGRPPTLVGFPTPTHGSTTGQRRRSEEEGLAPSAEETDGFWGGIGLLTSVLEPDDDN